MFPICAILRTSIVFRFTVPDVKITHSTKTKDQSPPSANLPSVPVCLNTVVPTPPTTEKPAKAKTAVPLRHLNMFSKEPVRGPQLGSKQTKAATTVQKQTTTGRDSARRYTEPQLQDSEAKKPYSMNLALSQNSGKTTIARLQETRTNSERYPKAKHVDNSNLKGKAYTSLSTKSTLRTGLRKVNTAVENMDSKRVRFQQESLQS